MGTTAGDLDVDALNGDLHGERVGGPRGLVCDYCGAAMPTGAPVCYEALRVADFPNLDQLLEVPDGWHLDAARCQDCELDAIDPATDGYDEALIMVTITETDGVLSLDASQLSVVDFVPTETGYYPPVLTREMLVDPQDYGVCRWLRQQGILEQPAATEAVREAAWESLRHSKEIPPQLEETRPEGAVGETESS